MCSENKARSVAFPSVGFGKLLKYPIDEVISCLIEESKIAAQTSLYIKKIKFVIYDESNVYKFKEALEKSTSGGCGNRLQKKGDKKVSFKGEKKNVTKTNETNHEALVKKGSRSHDISHKTFYSKNWIALEKLETTKIPNYWKHKSAMMDTGKDGNLEDVDDKIRDSVISIVSKTWESSLVGYGNDATGLSHSTILVTRVQRIENFTLYDKYFVKKKEFYRKLARGNKYPAIEKISSKGKRVSEKGPILTAKVCNPVLMSDMDLASDANEYYFFHGTPHEHVKNIVNKGIDVKFGGDNSMFGPAIYGAESSTKADQYSDHRNKRQNKNRKMFLIRLLLGNMYVTKKAHRFKMPPCSSCFHRECTEHDHEPFDSVVADGPWLFREFIVYRNDQCYPEYLITYNRV